MGYSKSKKTFSKLGRLFGVSSTNVNQMGLSAPNELSVSQRGCINEGDKDVSLHYENVTISPFSSDGDRRPMSPSSPFASSNRSSSVLLPHPESDNTLVHSQPHYFSSMNSDGAGLNLDVTSNENLNSLDPGNSTSSWAGVQMAPQQSKKASNISIHSTAPSPSAVSRASSVRGKPHQIREKESVAPLALPPLAVNKPRFKMLDDSLHEHHLRSAKRQEKLSNMLRDLLGAKKRRDGAKSAVSNILNISQQPACQLSDANSQVKPPTLFSSLVNQVKDGNMENNVVPDRLDSRSFAEKYGRCQEVIGKGSFGVVRISHKKISDSSHCGEEVFYAVKEFKHKPNESDKKYNRRLTSEFCISSSLKHLNIIDTLDLLKDAKGDYCEVMEFCSGGDLFTLIIAAGKLEYAEADCFFKQLITGVNYMHNMGVSHRDLKPENLLLTKNGVLKITDFGNGECFKMAWENDIQFSEGICGSSSYIAPEVFTEKFFDPRCVDIWACGVIYMAMRTGRQLWKLANAKKDEFFEEYLLRRKDTSGYDPIESLKRARCRNVIYSILDPKPERRITGRQILNSEWGREIRVCVAGSGLNSSSSSLTASASPPLSSA